MSNQTLNFGIFKKKNANTKREEFNRKQFQVALAHSRSLKLHWIEEWLRLVLIRLSWVV